MRKATKILIAGAAAAAAVVGTSGTASANNTSELYRGQTLNAGDWVFAASAANNGSWFQLIMQSDGNLVEYRWDGDPTAGQQSRSVCWSSNTMGSGANHATYQQDGNFVVYTPGGYAAWASNTAGGGGSSVDINSVGVVFVGYKAITGSC
ncbi:MULTISPECIES: hypothetical protein [Kitasatospora]|uniref:hypothetical protein n=1 Tax=Kitasatospora TaxID=2063 RepID=UPI0015D61D8F|nr:hypothetical protein [Kitasatospora sp. GP30]